MIWCWDTLSHIFVTLPQFWDTHEIMWATLCYWMNLKCLFTMLSASYLVIITCFWLRELQTRYLQDLLLFGIPDHWWVIRFLSLCSKSMHSNYVQNQSKVTAYPAEELRIQPVKWWSLWEGQLINKGALLPNAPHHWMTAHLTRAKQMKPLERMKIIKYETSNKNHLPLI